MLSSEEIEELEYKEMQENKFKAKPIDQRIFQSMGELGQQNLLIVEFYHPQSTCVFEVLPECVINYRKIIYVSMTH